MGTDPSLSFKILNSQTEEETRSHRSKAFIVDFQFSAKKLEASSSQVDDNSAVFLRADKLPPDYAAKKAVPSSVTQYANAPP